MSARLKIQLSSSRAIQCVNHVKKKNEKWNIPLVNNANNNIGSGLGTTIDLRLTRVPRESVDRDWNNFFTEDI